MSEILEFSNRAAFREWLHKNGTSSEGVWLLFGKKGGPTTLTAAEALEEALCYGWIDGQMQSLDSTKYKIQEVFCAPHGKQQMVGKEQSIGGET